MSYTIRGLKEADLPQINQLFIDTVHAINAKDYNQDQLAAWAPRDGSYKRWQQRLHDHLVYIAVENEKIIGFGDITAQGYLDHLFIHKDFQGQGVASSLLSKLEEKARNLGLKELHTQASITAKPFFERRGFLVMHKQEKLHNGVKLTNYVMHKTLK